MALFAAGPATAGPKLITGNPGKGATVIHCKAMAPGARGVIVITKKGKVNNNCSGLPATLARPAALMQLPQRVLNLLLPVLPPAPTP